MHFRDQKIENQTEDMLHCIMDEGIYAHGWQKKNR